MKRSLCLGDLVWSSLPLDASYKNSQIPKALFTLFQLSVPAFKDIKEGKPNQQEVEEKQANGVDNKSLKKYDRYANGSCPQLLCTECIMEG